MSKALPQTGMPPVAVTSLLRIEGAAIFVAAITAYAALGGNWWLFALLGLAPDLAFIALFLCKAVAARIYNLVHSYWAPLVLAGIGWFGGLPTLLPLALIWIAHIGADRALGYGLKYPDAFEHTHLGPIGKAKRAAAIADAG
ncbi:MAG: DUF4260 domain-containing protein [Devosia sp.]